MSSPEVEKFEVTDYDYENEFNIDRPQRRQTKTQAIYGSFVGDDSDDDEDDSAGFRRGGKKSYSSGISFISGGVKKSAKEEAEEAEAKKKEDESGAGVMDVDPLLQEQFGRPSRSSKQRKGIRNATNTGQRGIGDWEKSTKGVASKLMAAMGYKPGQGLGKKSQGISTPVEAKLRMGKGAIGFYGSERSERSLKDFPVKDEEKDEEEKFQQQLSQWKRGESTKTVKPSYVVKTADELIAKGAKRKTKEGHKAKKSSVKVIDMTGKEQRVLSGYHAIASKKAGESDDEMETGDRKTFDVPELIHNLNMLIDITEEDIITRDRQLRYEKDMKVNMEHEYERLEKLCKTEKVQIDRTTEVLSLIELFETRSQPESDDPLTLEECADIFTKLQDDYVEEYRQFDLVTLAIPVVFPLMRKYLSHWQPLSRPNYGCDIMEQWKKLLDMDRRMGDSTASHNAYSKLIWDVWMPILRTTISQWNSRNPDALIEVLEAWLPLLPSWTFQNILDQLVNPRLQMEVDQWNPLTDTVPIHAWLHPWLPLMGQRLEPLWAPIRHKLASALSKWHPSDGSAKLILKPWASVFSPGHMEAFMQRNIVPKLASCLQVDFIINPANQNLDMWHSVMSWQDLLTDQTLISLLDRCFFPRWLQTLTQWLNTAPNYEQVALWYKGWKSAMPERLIPHPVVRERFGQALTLMNTSVSNPGVPVIMPHIAPAAPPPPPIPDVPNIPNILSQIYGDSPPDMSIPSAPVPPAPSGLSRKKQPNEPIALPLSASVPHSFRALVEMKAEEEGLDFYPIQGKIHDSKQVYQCGSCQITVDRGVTFIRDETRWVPASMKELLVRAAKPN